MDIPNLSQSPTAPITTVRHRSNPKLINPAFLVVILLLGVGTGFVLSKVAPAQNSSTENVAPASGTTGVVSESEIKVGQVYGNTSVTFKDTATGTIEKGSINGEGTHILNREGGATQRASLTSSAVDLDLFVGKKVEVTGETNASKKTSWLLDVGTIKVLE